MKKITFLIILSSFIFNQTGIITSPGFRGYGLWAKVNKPFAEDREIYYDCKFEFYSSIGIEVSIGTLRQKNIKPRNNLGFGYHYKIRNLGFKLFYSKNLYDTYDFNQKENSYDYYSITLYRTSKLNPFFKISKQKGFAFGDIEGNTKNSIDELTLGGLGRITRYMTFSGSLRVPIIESFDINNSIIEASIGFVY